MRSDQSGNNSPLVARVMQHANMTSIFRAPALPSYRSSVRPNQSSHVEKAFALPPHAAMPAEEIPAGDVAGEQREWLPSTLVSGPPTAAIQAKSVDQPVTRTSTALPRAQVSQPDVVQPQVPPEKIMPTPETSQPVSVHRQPEIAQTKPIPPQQVQAPINQPPAARPHIADTSSAGSVSSAIQRQPMSQGTAAPEIRPLAAADISNPESPEETVSEEEKKTDLRLHNIMKLHQEKAAREASAEATAVEAGESDSGSGVSPASESVQRQVEASQISKVETAVDSAPSTPLPDVPKPRRPRPTFHQAKQSGATNVQSESKTTAQRSPSKSGQQLEKPPKDMVSETGGKGKRAGNLETIPAQPTPILTSPIQAAPDLESTNEIIQERADQNLGDGAPEIVDTTETTADQSQTQSVPESSSLEQQTADFSASDFDTVTELDLTSLSEADSPTAEMSTSPSEPIISGQEGAGDYTSSEPITVVSRRVEPEQVEPSNQPVQLLPEPSDEPAMIIERRPSNMVEDHIGGTSETSVQEGWPSKSDVPQPQTPLSFEQTVEASTSPQLTQSVQKLQEEVTTSEVFPGDDPGSGGVAYQEHMMPPLQEVWPVRVVPQPQESRQRESVPKMPVHSASSASETTGLQRKLASIPTAKPSDSSVVVMRPRLSRQVQRTTDLQPKTQHPVTNKVAESGQPAKEIQAEPPAMVQTEIGDLPADLWTLIGQKPPSSPAGNNVSVQTKKDTTPSVASNTVQKSVETTTFFSQPPVIQRAEERPPAPTPAAGVAEEGAGDAEAKGEAEIDVDSLAQQVFSQIKRRLSVEWERGRGRHGREW